MSRRVNLTNCSSIEDRIDEQCDAFELACRNGERPSIAEFIGAEDLANRSRLFRELLLVEVEYRHSRGEQPTAVDYLRAFPEYASQIHPVDFRGDVTAASTIRDNGAVLRNGRQAGARLAHFELIQRLGAGAMGEAWKAWDTRV